MQSEFRWDISLGQRLTRLSLSLGVSALWIYLFGPKMLRLAGSIIEGGHAPADALFLYFVFFGAVFFISFFAIAAIGWFFSLFDWDVVLRIDENGVFYEPEFRETIPWSKIRSYEIECCDGDYFITFEVEDPERYLKPPARLLGIPLFIDSEPEPGKASFSTEELDAVADRILDLFEQRWRESRKQDQV